MDEPPTFITCFGCGAEAPKTNTNYTLISSSFGWRLTRSVRADGTRESQWRCPSCWRELKARSRSEPGRASSGRIRHRGR